MAIKTFRFRQFINEMDENTPSNNYSKTGAYSRDFCKENWQDAVKLARYGIKNQSKIEKIMSNMALLEHVKTKGFGMQETGLCVDVGTYLNGEPECWIAEQFEYKPKKVVKILVCCSQSWIYEPKHIENRGAGIMSLIQMLKKQGYIVKINIYLGINYNCQKYFCFLNIPSNPLDIQSLSYALCSPSLLRRFGFAFLEQETKEDNCGSYGCPVALDEVVLSKDIIHFNGLNNEECRYDTEEETKKYISDLFDDFLKLNNDSRNGENE